MDVLVSPTNGMERVCEVYISCSSYRLALEDYDLIIVCTYEWYGMAMSYIRTRNFQKGYVHFGCQF